MGFFLDGHVLSHRSFMCRYSASGIAELLIQAQDLLSSSILALVVLLLSLWVTQHLFERVETFHLQL